MLAHRPLVALAIVSLRSGRAIGGWGWALILSATVDIAVPRSVEPAAAVATAGVAMATVASESMRWRPGTRRADVATQHALLGFVVALVLPHLLRRWPSGVAWHLPLLAYLLCMLLVCVFLTAGMTRSRSTETDAVIELVDADPEQALIRLERVASTSAPGAETGPVGAALTLLRENQRLQRELRSRVAEVRDSRARLLAAAIGERRRLAETLDQRAVRYLVELDRCLECLATADGEGVRSLSTQCRAQVQHTLDDLDRLAQGLHPRALQDGGLAVALTDLADRSTVRVDLSVPAGRFGEQAESTLWYACAEALTNADKHAQASRVSIRVTVTDGALTALIDDDGVGGAALTDSGGLTGLMDRLANVGGQLALASSAAGTRITVTVPR